MIQALAPRMPRGFSGVLLAIVMIAWAPSAVLSQATDDKPKADDKKAEAKPATEAPADPVPTVEVFTDPAAKKALGIFSPINYAGPRINGDNPSEDRSKVQSMAAKTQNIDPKFLENYVNFFAAELTRRDNLNAVLNPPAGLKPNAKEARGLERALDALTKPLIDGRANANQEFLTTYSKILFDSSLSKILENNYLSRIDAMIILGMAGSPTNQALDLYTREIKKPDQVIWVKLWAARGLTNASQEGKVDLDNARATLATEALVGFLESDAKLPWPAQIRALEALGSLRIATASLPRVKIDAASAVMKILADPDAKIESRAWAAWALGMMKVPQAVAPYNFSLIGHELGHVAVDLGQQIVQEFDDNKDKFEAEKTQAEHLTSLLLFQVYPALVGEDGVRDSGLIHSPHPNIDKSKDFLTKLEASIKAVTRESYELIRAGGALAKEKRDLLDAKLADLKRLLDSTPPKDRRLVPGGPEFAPANDQQVAGAPRP